MFGVKKLRAAFLQAMATPMKIRGYAVKRQEMFLSPTVFGYVGVRFVTADYNCLGTSLEYCVRHDVVNDTFDRATEVMGWTGWEGKALDKLKKDLQQCPSFRMSHNAIVGQKEHTTDDIRTEAEIQSLCKRWVERYDESADQFFSRFTNIETVADMYLNDDPFLAKLFNSDFHATVVHGVATLHAVRGVEAAKAYAKRHEKQMTHSNKRYGDIILGTPSPKDKEKS